MSRRAPHSKEEGTTHHSIQVHPPRLPPQQHLAGLAGCCLLKGKHLEVMTIGSGVLRVDIGAGEGREFHAVEQDSAIKGNEVSGHAATWMDQDLFPFLRLNTVPLHGYALLCFFIHPLMDIWIVTTILLL